jgi:hypothetical protein
MTVAHYVFSIAPVIQFAMPRDELRLTGVLFQLQELPRAVAQHLSQQVDYL